MFDLSTLKSKNRNPRKISADKMAKLKRSVSEFPKMLPLRPMIYDPATMEVLGGNQRLEALRQLGYKEIPDTWIKSADDMTEEEKRRFVIADNAGFGEWDWELLAEDWNADELAEWGVDLPEFEAVEAEAVEDDYEVPQGGIETDIVIGDLFEIGAHRLMCGDSTDSDMVAKLMGGEKADMVFTDPPYRLETRGGCVGSIGGALKKQGGDIDFISDFDPMEFLPALPLVFNAGKMNAYIFCNKNLLPDYLLWARDCGYSFNVLIWKKPAAIPIGGSHYPDIEYMLLFRKSAIWNGNISGVSYSRCLEFGREMGLHPTMKPIGLISNEMQISSNTGSLVFDFFLGSGSTMVAAHQLNRRCFGMELDPKYCQVIIDRMRKLDPDLVIKRNGMEI